VRMPGLSTEAWRSVSDKGDQLFGLHTAPLHLQVRLMEPTPQPPTYASHMRNVWTNLDRLAILQCNVLHRQGVVVTGVSVGYPTPQAESARESISGAQG
jgi:hypothetical protein